MARYSAITIIYNPNSTGSGKRQARRLEKKLHSKLPHMPVHVAATEYAGHAETLAYEAAMGSKHPLIISASGDGGYHEVINGLMQAVRDGAEPVAGLLPAGNANDHHRNLHRGDIAEAIEKQHEQVVDLLKLTAVSEGRPITRYAHSYIGVGLTPKVSQELNKTNLNRLKEMWIVTKVLVFLQPVRLVIHGEARTYDSLIFSNVAKMAKVMSISKQSRPDDGVFEVTAFRRRNKLRLIASLLKATTTGYTAGEQTSEFSFETMRPILVQLDGEIMAADAETTLTVSIDAKRLRCII